MLISKQHLMINGIPAILWGAESNRLFIAVHGNMSAKDDVPIAILAEEACTKGYRVLSFDLPEHGDRKNSAVKCKVQTCVEELHAVFSHAQDLAGDISLFACSMGAYFSLLAYKDSDIAQALFLSPVVDMERIIDNMMRWFNIGKERLEAEQEIDTPIGQKLYWDYYSFVKSHPVTSWKPRTSILYGSKDNISERDTIDSFVGRYGAELTVHEGGEHYFHTDEQLAIYRKWLQHNIGTGAASEHRK